MNHAQGLIEEAVKHEDMARKLREAAAILGISSAAPKTSNRGRMADLVKLLRKEKTIRVAHIVRRLGIAKPTVYLWLKKKDIFVNKKGAVSLRDASKA